MTFVYEKKYDRVIPGIGNKAKIINVQCCFYFFCPKVIYLCLLCIFVYRKPSIRIHDLLFRSFRFCRFMCPISTNTSRTETKKNKIVLFANKLLNIIILKRKQNVSNCEYFKQNQSNANENERKKERDNETEWNENSNKTDSKLWYMQHGTGTHSAQMSVFLKLVCGVSRFVYASINQWWLSVWRGTG